MKPLRAALTTSSIVILLALSGFAGCQEQKAPKESVESLRQKSDTLRDKVRLRIGVRENLPYLSSIDPKTGEHTGFEPDLAKALAAELGFTEDKIDWVPVTDMFSRMEALQTNLADMVVASLTMVPERPAEFAGPYLVMPQAVMVSKQSTKRIETIADLRSANVVVCVGVATTSEKALVDKGIKPEPVNLGSQCVDGLKQGKYDAYSSDLQNLASVAASNPEQFRILDVIVSNAPEEIGVAVPKGDTALRDLLAYFFSRWLKGPQPSPWKKALDRSIGPYLGQRYQSQPRVKNPPDLVDYDSKVRVG